MTNEVRKPASIKNAIIQGSYRYTIHAAQQRIARNIKRNDIEDATINGEIIEYYPNHHYGPACLIFGKTKQGRTLHILFAFKPIISIITVYEPGFKEWQEDLKTRRN